MPDTDPPTPPLLPAITDTDRLNFLEQTQQPLYVVYTDRKQYDTTGSGPPYHIVQHFEGWCVNQNAGEHPSPRDAIDAAMALCNGQGSEVLSSVSRPQVCD